MTDALYTNDGRGMDDMLRPSALVQECAWRVCRHKTHGIQQPACMIVPGSGELVCTLARANPRPGVCFANGVYSDSTSGEYTPVNPAWIRTSNNGAHTYLCVPAARVTCLAARLALSGVVGEPPRIDYRLYGGASVRIMYVPLLRSALRIASIAHTSLYSTAGIEVNDGWQCEIVARWETGRPRLAAYADIVHACAMVYHYISAVGYSWLCAARALQSNDAQDALRGLKLLLADHGRYAQVQWDDVWAHAAIAYDRARSDPRPAHVLLPLAWDIVCRLGAFNPESVRDIGAREEAGTVLVSDLAALARGVCGVRGTRKQA